MVIKEVLNKNLKTSNKVLTTSNKVYNKNFSLKKQSSKTFKKGVHTFKNRRRVTLKVRNRFRNYWLSQKGNARWFLKKRWQRRLKTRLRRYLINLKIRTQGLGLWAAGLSPVTQQLAAKTIRAKPYSSTRRLRTVYKRRYMKKYKYPFSKRVKTLAGMPKYINYRQLFYNQMIEKQVFRSFYRFKERNLVKHFRQAIKSSKRLFDTAFIKHFEFRLDTVVYRANMAFNLLQARQQVKLGYFTVNNITMRRPNYNVTIGDCIMPQKFLIQNWTYCFSRLYTRPLQVDQYPSYLMLNERVPVAMIFQNPDINQIKHSLPISWQFMSFAMLKYN